MNLDFFRRDGALDLRGLFANDKIAALGELAREGGPGRRLHHQGLPASIKPATSAAKALIGDAARPVRAVLFDKTPDANWAVA